MAKALCGIFDCSFTAIKFCCHCQKQLCKKHKKEDELTNKARGLPEHYYISIEGYEKDRIRYHSLLCEHHPGQEIRTECVNCKTPFCISCNHHQTCKSSAGRHHDPDTIDDIANRYRVRLAEYKRKLEEKNSDAFSGVKEAHLVCGRLMLEQEKMIQEVDRVVECQTNAIISQADRLKEEIKEMFTSFSTKIDAYQQNAEQLEVKCRTLSCNLSELSSSAAHMVVKGYRYLENDILQALNMKLNICIQLWRTLIYNEPCRSLELKLEPLADGHSTEELIRLDSPSLLTGTRSLIEYDRTYCAENLQYQSVVFISANRLLTSGYNANTSTYFIEIIHNYQSQCKTSVESAVYQVLPYKDSFLVLLCVEPESLTGTFRIELFSSSLLLVGTLYEWTDYCHYYRYICRPIGVTSDNLITVIDVRSKRLVVVSIENANILYSTSLLDLSSSVRQVTVDDDHVIISDYWKNEITKYNIRSSAIVWSRNLTTPGSIAFSQGLIYSSSNETIYVLRESDGQCVERLRSAEFSDHMLDLSVRVNKIATVSEEGIKFFTMVDVI